MGARHTYDKILPAMAAPTYDRFPRATRISEQRMEIVGHISAPIDGQQMCYEHVIPSICNSRQAPVHAIIMFLSTSCGWVGISPELAHMGNVHQMKSRALKGLV